MTAYLEALAALEQSGLGHAARNSEWLFLVVNVLHVLGAAMVVGGIAVFDLKVLTDEGLDAPTVGRVAVALAAAGVALQVPTGLTLLAVEATKLGINPAFYSKMAFLTLGLVNVALFHHRFGSALSGGSLPPEARVYALVSLGAWVLVLVAGRTIAYL